MIHLAQYLENIDVDGVSYQAYRMDGTAVNRQMRIDAGLGTCSCCDYFILDNDSVVLIEVTQLNQTITKLKKKYSYLNDLHRKKIITKLIKQENRIKVYGSILVIYQLTSMCSDLANLLQNKSYKFWLVMTGKGKVNSEDYLFYEGLHANLKPALQGQLSPKLMKDVKIVPSQELPNILTNLQTAT